MNFKDFELGLERGDFSMNDTYWVVDYSFCKYKNKIIRYIEPTEVAVFDKRTSWTNKWIISTNYYFRAIGKLGRPLSKIIPAYNSMSAGTALHVFVSEEHAESFYKEQCSEVLEEIRVARDKSIDKWNLIEAVAHKRLNAHRP